MPDISPGVQQTAPPVTPPGASGLDALGLPVGSDPASQAAYAALKEYIASLNAAGQQAALASIQQQIAAVDPKAFGPGGFPGGFLGPNPYTSQITTTQLSNVLRTLQSEIGPAGTQYNPTAPGIIPPAAPATGTTAASTPGQTPVATSLVSESSALTPQQYIDLMRLWGLSSNAEVDQMVQSFRESYSVTYSLNANADIVGGPGTVTAGAAASTLGSAVGPTSTEPGSPFAEFQQEQTALGTAGVGSAPWTMSLTPNLAPGQSPYYAATQNAETPHGRQPGSTPNQRLNTAQDVYAAVIGSSGAGGIATRILTQYQEKYLNDTGQPMPPELLAKLQTAIAGLSPSEQQQWLEQSIQKPGGTIAIAALDTVLNLYESQNPTPTQTEQRLFTAVDSSIFAALHRHATAADMAALGPNPTDIQIQQYVNEQPSPVKGFANYGQYNAAYYNLKTYWNEYFSRDPNAQELAWSVGKDPQEIQDYIRNSSSAVPGITIGRYDDYLNYIQGLDTQGTTGNHAFSEGVDASLMQQLHSAVTKAATGKAAPAPLPA